jgi:hypothetical protein
MTDRFLLRVASIGVSIILGTLAVASEPAARDRPPPWAFAINPPTGAADRDVEAGNDVPQHVPGSEAAFTLAQIDDFFNPPDWHPANHPIMPEVVARGRRPDLFPCA